MYVFFCVSNIMEASKYIGSSDGVSARRFSPLALKEGTVIGNHSPLLSKQMFIHLLTFEEFLPFLPSREAFWVSNSGQRPATPRRELFFQKRYAQRISNNTQTGQYKNSLLRQVETCPAEEFLFEVSIIKQNNGRTWIVQVLCLITMGPR